MAKIKKEKGKNERNWKLHALLVGIQIGAATMGIHVLAPQKARNRPAIFPSSTTPENVPRMLFSATETHAHPYL